MLEKSPYRAELEVAVRAVTAAAVAVRDLYDRNAADAYTKGDGSPVTDGDLAADRIIRDILAERAPGVPILTEEGADDEGRLKSERVWIADPIDGTVQFVQRTGNFDVLLALVEGNRPVVVAALQPPTGRLCAAVAGSGAWVGKSGRLDQRVDLTRGRSARPTIGTSIWFGAPDNLGLIERIAAALGGTVGNVSQIGFTPRRFLEPGAFDLLLGVRADGSQTMASEWDFAVGDLFLHEAGGRLTDLDGELFVYNKRRPLMTNGLVASLDPALHAEALRVLADDLP